jgi:lysozyme
MPSLEYHPNRVMYSSRYASAAAGAYQFMPFTWAMASRTLGLRGFHAEAQDQAALFLIQRRGALPLADRGELTPELTALLAPEWASFPTLQGASFYGQPVKRFEDLKNFYENNLSQIRAGGGQQGVWERVAVRPSAPTCRDDSLSCRLKGISAAETGVNP